MLKKAIICLAASFMLATPGFSAVPSGLKGNVFNVKDFGASGKGSALDTEAINAAVEAAAQEGGTVLFPAGVYKSFSIHMKSGVTLHLEEGAVLKAAAPGRGAASPGVDCYDFPEANPWDMYQDFGHSHWHNSLIWGEKISDIAFEGKGVIDGTDALIRWDPRPGGADKAIALKECNNVTVRDLTFINSGHFSLLFTGVDNVLIQNVTVDTNRDAFDIDCCADVKILDCNVNSVNDDAIVLKCSYALGYPKATENVLVTGCHVSGYDTGTYLDGRLGTTITEVPDHDGPCGRIKLGTESNGGFNNIRIEDCSFTHCRGLALETVDGACMENIEVRDIVMKDIVNSPIYIRLGGRMRGPETLPASIARNITISNVKVEDADSRYACLIVGMEDAPVENVLLQDISISYRASVSDLKEVESQAGANSFFHYDGAVYPEPSAHGIQPAWGLSISYARNVIFRNVKMDIVGNDARPETYIGPSVTNFIWD